MHISKARDFCLNLLGSADLDYKIHVQPNVWSICSPGDFIFNSVCISGPTPFSHHT